MNIKVKASPSEDSPRTFNIEIDMSETEWEKLSDREQQTIIQGQLDELPDQPYWSLDSY